MTEPTENLPKRDPGLSIPPPAAPPAPSMLSGRLLVAGVVVSATLLGVSIWLSIEAERNAATLHHKVSTAEPGDRSRARL